MPTVTIAHVSDVHLGPIAGLAPRFLNLKRVLGLANWLRHRRGTYQRSVLDRIVADLQQQAPDHIAVTGDLVNIGLPQEHINALAWLGSLGPPDRVSVVPGNHDIYSWLGDDPGCLRWSAHMSSDTPQQGTAPEFPFVRQRGAVALIGVNSAVPTPPFVASGRAGVAQLARLRGLLGRLRGDGSFRVLLIHHPPLPGLAKPRHELVDADALQGVLSEHGAELVIHGHNHTNTLAWCAGPQGAVPVVGVPSGSLGRHTKRESLARYNLYVIEPGGRTVEMIGRGLAEPGGGVVELERRTLAPPEH